MSRATATYLNNIQSRTGWSDAQMAELLEASSDQVTNARTGNSELPEQSVMRIPAFQTEAAEEILRARGVGKCEEYPHWPAASSTDTLEWAARLDEWEGEIADHLATCEKCRAADQVLRDLPSIPSDLFAVPEPKRSRIPWLKLVWLLAAIILTVVIVQLVS